MAAILGLDIGSNSVGSAWVDAENGHITVGVSVFPAGVDESDEKRGDPKNAKRRNVRRTRVTLARRAARKRKLRQKLLASQLLPKDGAAFQRVLQQTDPWVLRRKGLTESLTPDEFGRVLLHLAQRRGAMGFDADIGDKGKVKAAITQTQFAILAHYGSQEARLMAHELRDRIDTLSAKKNRTDEESVNLDKAQDDLKTLCKSVLQSESVSFGRLIADLRDERRTEITSPDRRKVKRGPREWRNPIRNRAGRFEFHADRAMIRDEFAKLWDAQRRLGGEIARLLTDELRRELDDETSDSVWRHRGLLFGQRSTYWEAGTLGRCVLEPTERCVPHADMHASRYLVVETLNNLKVIENGKEPRALTSEERRKIKQLLSGPLGLEKKGKREGKPKRSVTVTDLRELLGWGPASKKSPLRFNIESDEDRVINTDWFNREIVHGAVTLQNWEQMSEHVREGINRAILKHDPDDEKQAAKLMTLLTDGWAALSEEQAALLIAAWKRRPRPDAKRLNMSRRAVRNLLTAMDRADPWPVPNRPDKYRWLTQIEARKQIADDKSFKDVTTQQPLDDHARRRYATGAKGATARDRHYLNKHKLMKNGELVVGHDGQPLAEPPPAPMISNPVVRKAIHEVRRHLIEYMITFGHKPDEVYIELAREAKMGKMDADRVLFVNRLRNRIRNEIIRDFELEFQSSTQQREAVRRVVLCVQQGGICPLCGNQVVTTKITERMAANGDGCEVAHIIPRGTGGDNRQSNVVLAHTKCNRDMGRRAARQFWDETLRGGFEEGMRWVEDIYRSIERISPSDTKTAVGIELWRCYFAKPAKRGGFFSRYDDHAKIEQFKKDVKDVQGMTERQEAATKYAARQVMAYLADALFGGNGLPERGGLRRIFSTDGIWTSRLRREWGLFFDPHSRKAKGLTDDVEHERKEKDRGDHRHHAIDAVVIACCTDDIKRAWEAREKQAESDRINTADEEAMDNYRRLHPLKPPAPYRNREEFREAVREAVFGNRENERPVCHRPVKRKLIGALHEETLFAPVLDREGNLTGNYTATKSVLDLEPNHLRMPRPETANEAIERLAARRRRTKNVDDKTARKWARKVVTSAGYQPAMVDPPPGKSGIVRDVGLRRRIRACLSEYCYVGKTRSDETNGTSSAVDPDSFTANEIKQCVEAGGIRQESGVPIRTVVLLRAMSDPVIVDRREPEYSTGQLVPAKNPEAKRAYVGGNNHHIEIRVAKGKGGREVVSGKIVTAFEAAQRKLSKLRALRQAEVPDPAKFRKLKLTERAKFKPILRAIEKAHPLVDRSTNEDKGGVFIMSLCEGETLWMRDKRTPDTVGHFVVAKLDKPQTIVLVPHWDARAATGRKDDEGKKVPDSNREQFPVVPADLKTLAPPGQTYAVKVRVSPLGRVTSCQGD
jgi:CRISPR-associated endonuclease Csn1